MTGIGVIADSHANLPATRAALDALEGMECDEVIHVGDAVGIGPHPAEVVFACAREPASVHQSSNAARFSSIHSSKGSGSRPLASVTPD